MAVQYLTYDVTEFTPAFLAAGALSGLNSSWSFLAGAILAWGIIGPLTVSSGVAFGNEVDSRNVPGWMDYSGFSKRSTCSVAHVLC